MKLLERQQVKTTKMNKYLEKVAALLKGDKAKTVAKGLGVAAFAAGGYAAEKKIKKKNLVKRMAKVQAEKNSR